MHAAQQPIGSMEAVSRLGDDELTATVQRLLRQERTVSATLLIHLAEVDTRELYRRHAYSSMFDYCVQRLHLSESEAYLRIRAARLHHEQPYGRAPTVANIRVLCRAHNDLLAERDYGRDFMQRRIESARAQRGENGRYNDTIKS